MELPYKDVGPRLEAMLRVRGYVKASGELDVERFSWDGRFGRTNIYNWLSNTAVPFKDLTRLCDFLGCSERWLLTGVERPKVSRRVKGLVLVLGLGAGALLPSVGWPAEPRGAARGALQAPSYRKSRDARLAA